MPLMPYQEYPHSNRHRREPEHFLNDFPHHFDNTFGNPRIDIYETEDEVIASCEVAGLEKQDDIDINIEDNVLTIMGSIRKEQDINDDQVHRKERFVGRFQRSVTMPVQVESDGATATYKKGILELRMPKKEHDNRKRIDVEFH